jgi:hypothetical protein
VSYKCSVFAAVLCTMALVATCVAQSSATFGVVTTDQSSTGWTPRNIYVVDVTMMESPT